MKENSKLIIAIAVFLLVGIIIIPRTIKKSKVPPAEPVQAELPEEEPPEEEDPVYMYSTGNLNLRTGPGSDFDIILTIPANSRVQVLNQDGNWYEVLYQEKSGYSAAKYLTEEQ